MTTDTAKSEENENITDKETAEERFIRLAAARGSKLVDQFKLLSRLGSSYNYRVNLAVAKEWLAKFDAELAMLRATWSTVRPEKQKKAKKEVVELDNVIKPETSPKESSS